MDATIFVRQYETSSGAFLAIPNKTSETARLNSLKGYTYGSTFSIISISYFFAIIDFLKLLSMIWYLISLEKHLLST